MLFLVLCLLPAGCMERTVNVFPAPGNATESAEVIRSAPAGPVLISFASYPLRDGAPPDGVRAALIRSLGRSECSAACFFWTEREMADRWLAEQLLVRRERGLPQRVILMGHGLGATGAAEFARDLLFRDREVEIVLLLTVDAVKSGVISGGAAAASNALVGRLPGVNMSFTAYDAAPVPGNQRFWSHVNYYQNRSSVYHGTAMPGAENHLLDDSTGLLNHGNADDFAMPLLATDIRTALERSRR